MALKFGSFMAPFHPPATTLNPSTAYQRDVEVIQHMDKLGYDEVWVGEHHSCGTETIPDPFMFIMYMANLTKHIKLGCGVVSLPYHNPLWVADRALFADRMLRGRFQLGVGPGALPVDATMIGISLEDQRGALEEDFDVLMALLRGESVTHKTSRYNLVDARTQAAPYSDFDVCVCAIASPTGPRAASKNGAHLISVGATAAGGFDALALHWDVMEERSTQFGTTADRSKWRLAGPMHLADTKEEAIEQVRYGLDAWCDYTQDTLAAPHFRAVGRTFEERVAWVNESGLGVIGTPDDAVRQIERLQQQSGGFGSYLLINHEWARHTQTLRSLELFADNVMPRFQGSADRILAAEQYARSRWNELDVLQGAAIASATQRHADAKVTAGV